MGSMLVHGFKAAFDGADSAIAMRGFFMLLLASHDDAQGLSTAAGPVYENVVSSPDQAIKCRAVDPRINPIVVSRIGGMHAR